MELLIENATLAAPGAPGRAAHLHIEGGRIAAITPPARAWTRTRLDASGCLVLPGFIDLHIHGADGADTMDATPEALARMSAFLARHGVTAFLATTVTAGRAAIDAALAAVGRVRALPGARLLGVHLEGPYLSPGRAGAQDPGGIRPADPDEYRPWLASGHVRLITLAPEIPQNRALLVEAVARGIVAAAGHSQAAYEDVEAAIALGLRSVSHTFNAMPALHHRAPGLLGAALSLDALCAELIADRVHVHPAVIRLLIRAKGPQRVALVSDAMRATGLAAGGYTLGEARVTVAADGSARLADRTLAGSTLTLDRAVRHAMEDAGLDLATAALMASATPARLLGLDSDLGRLAPGARADLVLWDPQRQAVRATLVGGGVAFDGSA